MVTVPDIKEMVDNILKNNYEETITLPLKDLVWAMVNYSYNIKENEELIHSDSEDNIILTAYNHTLLVRKECSAARRDELGRLISQYSDFNTQRVYEETRKIFLM